MNRLIVLTSSALLALCSCASHNLIYKPATSPEIVENNKYLLDVYPGDIRRNLDIYTNVGVGWVGIIRSTVAHDGPDGLIHAETTFEHHYFDWQEDRHLSGIELSVSPRGEGLFATDWELSRTDPDATSDAAEQYASPGSLAIVYGVPEKVDDNGTVVLRYRYLRIIPPSHFSTNEFDYGRFGEPFLYIDTPGKPK